MQQFFYFHSRHYDGTYNDNVEVRHQVVRKHAHQYFILTHAFEPITFPLQTHVVRGLNLLLGDRDMLV